MLAYFHLKGSDRVLFATPSGLKQLTGATEIVDVPEHLPVDVTGREPVGKRVAVVNAFSTSYGDQLNALAAFRVWRRRHPDCEVTFYQVDRKKIAGLNPPDVAVYRLPNLLSHLCSHDCFYDFGSFITRPSFQKLPMVDFFLAELGIDFESVDPKDKRIRYEPANHVEFMRIPRAKKRPILLFHHEASSRLRTMPDVQARRLIAEIVRCSDYLVMSACGLESPHQFCGLGDRFIDVSPWCLSFDNLASIVSQVDCVVSVDSVPIHLADAFSVPCVGLFNTIDPALRIKYYPHCRSISLGVSGCHKMLGISEQQANEITALWSQVSGSQIVELAESICTTTQH